MKNIRDDIKKAYTDAVESGNSTGALYITDMTDKNYGETPAVQSFGCGDPVRAALLKEGERVLDLGSGAGFDLILASKKVGPSGYVYGLDMTDAMVEKARKNIAKLQITNVTVLQGYIEEMPIKDKSVDVLISNCVINLSPEKERVFAEAYRVLDDGGRFCVSDVVLMKKVPEKVKNSSAAWSG
ncbi:MAG: methyltransferase domain-containing protein [Synergistaceae bacterium]